jgi:hypothetical protein
MKKLILFLVVLMLVGCSEKVRVFEGDCVPVNWGETYSKIFVSAKNCNIEDFVLDNNIKLFQTDSLGDTLNIISNTVFHINYNATMDTVLIQMIDEIEFPTDKFQVRGYLK